MPTKTFVCDITTTWRDATFKVTTPSYFALLLRRIRSHINPILLVVQSLVDERITLPMSLRHESQYDSS